jgi:tRNA-dihydrouridine synthase
MLIDCKGEYIGSREMRKHAAWYTKGYAGSSHLRGRMNEAASLDDLKGLMDDFIR